MSDYEDSLSILRDPVFYGIEKANLHNVVKLLQGVNNFFEIPVVPIKEPSNIFENPNFGSNAANGGDEDGEAVSRILQAHLMAVHAKRLARGATDQNVCLRQQRFSRQHSLSTRPMQVSPVSAACICVHLETVSCKSSGFKSESEATASGKKINHERPTVPDWLQNGVNLLSIANVH